MSKILVEETRLDFSYYVRAYKERLGEGSYGVTWKVDFAETDNLDEEIRPAALKILKPFPPSTPGVDPLNDFKEEIGFLKKLRHPRVVRILRNGKCRVKSDDGSETETLYYLSEFEEGMTTLATLLERPIDADGMEYGIQFLLTLIEEVLAPLAYCHSRNIIHLDLHPGNILIKTSKHNGELQCTHAVLIDFGKAKHMNPDRLREYESVGGGLFEYKHPDLRPYLRKNRVSGSVFSGPEAQRFDLYAVAVGYSKILERARREDRDSTTGRLLGYTIRALRNEGQTVAYTISDALKTIRRSADPELSRRSILLRLSGQMNVLLDRQFLEVIDTPEFQRLRKVYQLCFTHFVYPSATHSRFSHSLGAFHLCGHYLDNLFHNSADFRFEFEKDALTNARLAALLHDLGHYPFAHYFEELGKLPADEPIHFGHEAFTERILRGDLGMPESALITRLKNRFGSEYLQSIQTIRNAPVISEVLSGPIDCDKVDYLVRDGLSCGVPYASSIDLQRLTASLTCVKQPPTGMMRLEITPKGIAPVESIINARYHLFSEVYWHKTCRAVAAIIKHAMYLAVTTGRVRQSDLDKAAMNCDDWAFLNWLYAALSKSHSIEAQDLIKHPLLSGKRKLYKRIVTISAIWDRGKPDSAYDHLETKYPNTYQDVVKIQESLISELNAYGSSQVRNWSNLAQHELLLDAPPAQKDILYFPEVYYETDINRIHHYEFPRVSGIISDIKLLKKTQKIRLFVHADRENQLLGLPDLNGTVRKIIRSI